MHFSEKDFLLVFTKMNKSKLYSTGSWRRDEDPDLIVGTLGKGVCSLPYFYHFYESTVTDAERLRRENS